jgi:hypothetical protein
VCIYLQYGDPSLKPLLFTYFDVITLFIAKLNQILDLLYILPTNLNFVGLVCVR